MRLVVSLTIYFASLSLLSQEQKDYVVKLNNDTVYVKIERVDKKMRSVLCEENKTKIRYEAKDILMFKYDTSFYEAASVRLKRSNQFVFLRRTIHGKLSLYEINIKRTKLLMKNFGEDLVHLRWVYRAQDWAKKVPITVYFYKKEHESNKNFSKYWKEKTQDCKSLQDKIKSKTITWTPTPKELVLYYNLNCI